MHMQLKASQCKAILTLYCFQLDAALGDGRSFCGKVALRCKYHLLTPSGHSGGNKHDANILLVTRGGACDQASARGNDADLLRVCMRRHSFFRSPKHAEHYSLPASY